MKRTVNWQTSLSRRIKNETTLSGKSSERNNRVHMDAGRRDFHRLQVTRAKRHLSQLFKSWRYRKSHWVMSQLRLCPLITHLQSSIASHEMNLLSSNSKLCKSSRKACQKFRIPKAKRGGESPLGRHFPKNRTAQYFDTVLTNLRCIVNFF